MLNELSIRHWLRDEPSEPHELLFHYTTRESLRAIMQSAKLRLNPFDHLNDPRERSKWFPRGVTLPEGGVTVGSLEKHRNVSGEIDNRVRLGVRVACFTLDKDQAPDACHESYFHRGWARARMWQQYGEVHKGAVLVFDRAALLHVLDQACDDDDSFEHHNVDYVDRPLHLPLKGSYEPGPEIAQARDAIMSDHAAVRDLYFVKNLDWSSETKFRSVLVLGADNLVKHQGEPVDLSFGDSLKAIVLGERWDGADWLAEGVRHLRLDQGNVLRCKWVNGAPVLDRYDQCRIAE